MRKTLSLAARKSAIGTLWRTYATLWGMAEGDGMAKWKPGLPLAVEPTEDLKKLGNLVMTATLAVWQTETDRYVYAFALSAAKMIILR